MTRIARAWSSASWRDAPNHACLVADRRGAVSHSDREGAPRRASKVVPTTRPVRARQVVAALLTLAGALSVLAKRVPALREGSQLFWVTLAEDFVAKSVAPPPGASHLRAVDGLVAVEEASRARAYDADELFNAEHIVHVLEAVAQRVSNASDDDQPTCRERSAGQWAALVREAVSSVMLSGRESASVNARSEVV